MKQFFSSCNKLWAIVVFRNREKKLSPVVIHLSPSTSWSSAKDFSSLVPRLICLSFPHRLHTVPHSLFSEGMVAYSTGVECLMAFIYCSLLPKKCSSGLPRVAAMEWDLCWRQSLRGISDSVKIAFLESGSPAMPSTFSPSTSSYCSSTQVFCTQVLFLYLLPRIQTWLLTPNSCCSCLNMFEWGCHVLLWLDICSLWTGPILLQSPRRWLCLAQGSSWAPQVTPTAPDSETLPVLPSTPPFPKQSIFPILLLICVCTSLAVHCWLLSLGLVRIYLQATLLLKYWWLSRMSYTLEKCRDFFPHYTIVPAIT